MELRLSDDVHLYDKIHLLINKVFTSLHSDLSMIKRSDWNVSENTSMNMHMNFVLVTLNI